MERRAIVAAVLCLIVLVGYQEVLRHLYPEPHPTTLGDAPEPVETLTPEAPSAANRDAIPAPAVGVGQLPVSEPVIVDTELFTARIETLGGRISSLRLKAFRTAVNAESEPLEMIQVAPEAAAPLGVRLSSTDGKVVEDDTRVVYAADRHEVTLRGSDTQAVVLRGTLASGVTIEKRLVFSAASYPFSVEVTTPAAPTQLGQIGLGWRHQILEAMSRDPEAHYRGTLVLEDKKVVRELATSLAGTAPKSFQPPVSWAGYADHYFLAALIPDQPATSRATVSPENNGVQLLVTSMRSSSDSAGFTVFVGPKDVEILATVGHQLERAVDFGWFSFLAVPLLRLLKAFHRLTGNYGIDIIILTILVKVLFIPLTNRSMKSMRDMQRLQPQMAKLREKFKDDRERLNKEMIELYRRHRVNPLGGCLPMLLQFPVFIGLYQALSQAIELRHAKFAFWVHDLSAHECYPWPGQGTISGCNELNILGVPFPILVLLMGGSMILQQYLSPSTGMDPAQQRMMMVLMPVMFTVMFVNFPSGLVLYWLVNNVLTIAQQWWSNRETPATRPIE
ncbi:MAG: membrane protein insertase YidC [Dehalococcoidia bacterium]|nr:membrane protein insertase YidC [Dehalococcoidia bacterium]